MNISQTTATTSDSSTALADLGAHLRARRLGRRMTHDTVSQLLGFSRQTLSRIERGDPAVAIGQVIRYAQLVEASAFSVPDAAESRLLARGRVRRTAAERTQGLAA